MFDSSGEPAAFPGVGGFCATSCEEGADATMKAPMDYESSMG